MAQTNLSGPLNVTGAIVSGGALTMAGVLSGERFKVTEYGADGAIAIESAIAVITKGTAAAMTLAAPTAAQNGTLLCIISATAAAHTVTQTTPGFNGAGATGDVGTFAAAIGSGLLLVAHNAVWLIVNNTGVTVA